MASPLPDKWDIDDKGIITTHFDKFISSNLNKFSLETEVVESKMKLQDYSGSDYTHHFHGIYYGSFQGRKSALESFCGIHLSGTCGVFCIL